MPHRKGTILSSFAVQASLSHHSVGRKHTFSRNEVKAAVIVLRSVSTVLGKTKSVCTEDLGNTNVSLWQFHI